MLLTLFYAQILRTNQRYFERKIYDISEDEISLYKLAIDSYKEASRLRPTDENYYTYSSMASLYKEIGSINKAIDIYKLMLQIKPDYIETYFPLADLYEEMEDNSNAIDIYKKAIHLIEKERKNTQMGIYTYDNDNVGWKYYHLGRLYVKAGNKVEAMKVYEALNKFHRPAAKDLFDLIDL